LVTGTGISLVILGALGAVFSAGELNIPEVALRFVLLCAACVLGAVLLYFNGNLNMFKRK